MTEPAIGTRAYPFRKGRLAWFMVVAILVTLFAALACLAAPAFPQHMWLARIGGGLAIVLFGGAAVFFAGRLFGHGPGLVLDREGIIDNSTYSSVGRIPWSEISGVRVARPPAYRNSLYGDPRQFIDRSNPLKRWFLRANAAGLGSPVAISPASVHIDTDELAQYIRRISGVS